MATYAAVMTTGTWDPFVAKQFDRARVNVKSGDMFVLANETDGPLAIPQAYHPQSISEAMVRDFGLPILYDETLFCHNLDYFYIIFYRNNPAYEYYVFFDFPVFIDTDVDALIAWAAHDEVALVAQPLDVPLADWAYTKPHASVYPPSALQGTLLPMVILSNAALAHLMRQRLALSARYAQQPDFFWPFCEAFVPTELKLAGFKAAPLSDYGAVERFSWRPPILEGTLSDRRAPGFVHPLLDRPRYVAAMLQHTTSRDLFGKAIWTRLSQRLPLTAYIGPLLAAMASRLRQLVLKRLLPVPQKKTALLWKATPRPAPARANLEGNR
jgi:hypothetical protein